MTDTTGHTPSHRGGRRRSHAGRIVGAALAVAGATGVGVGLHNSGHASAGAGAFCGGTERWDVKGATDQDADSINETPVTTSVAQLNQLQPGPIDAGGRMEVEKTEYTVTGYIEFFKSETDSDYHIVITDDQGGYSNGHSVVVEIPDPNCFAGKQGQDSSTSRFQHEIEDARKEFESKTGDVSGTAIPPQSLPVTVTGVAFFDFLHGQKGHALPKTGDDGQQKVIELHPVTAITFAD